MAEVVVEGHPHEGLAQVGVDQGVGARILARNVGLRAVHPDPLVRVGGAVSPSLSMMPVVTAVSVAPCP